MYGWRTKLYIVLNSDQNLLIKMYSVHTKIYNMYTKMHNLYTKMYSVHTKMYSVQ